MSQCIRLLAAMSLACWLPVALAFTVIPVDCVVELVKNGKVEVSSSGPCSYGKPLVMSSPNRMTFRVGVEAGGAPEALKWITQDVKPGFSATVYLGHDLSEQNPTTNLTVDYSLVDLLNVRKVQAPIGDGSFVELEMPETREVASSGASIFKKGEVRSVNQWSEGLDTYEVRIGIR